MDRDKELMAFNENEPTIDDFIQRLTSLQDTWTQVSRLPTLHNIGPLSLSNESVKVSLKNEIDRWKELFCNEIHAQVRLL